MLVIIIGLCVNVIVMLVLSLSCDVCLVVSSSGRKGLWLVLVV